MDIHPILESDLPAVLDVYRQCEDFLALGPVAKASMQMVLADLALSREGGGEFNGIFGEDGRLIGVFDFIRAGFEGDPNCAFLELLMIAAPFRSLGIGARAVAWLEGELRRAGIGRLRAGVQVNNPQAIRFWQRMGFAITSQPEQMADGTTCYQLEKRIIEQG